MLKKCKTCEIEKELSYFPKHLECIDGHSGSCKSCKKIRDKKRLSNIELSEKITPVDNLKICATCKIEKLISNFSSKSDTTDGLMKRCKLCVSKHYKNNKEAVFLKQKLYYEENKKAIGDYKNKWVKKRRDEDSFFKLKNNISPLIRGSFKHSCEGTYKKGKKTESILGCTMEEFKQHIESQFLNWMNWDNYGNTCGTELKYNCSWDLDHIVPISYAKTEEEIYILNHWSNFQPLCSKINRDIKKAVLHPCTNLELKITKIK
jgi:hypothetical protein